MIVAVAQHYDNAVFYARGLEERERERETEMALSGYGSRRTRVSTIGWITVDTPGAGRPGR